MGILKRDLLKGGDVSLYARIVNTSFKQQILKHDFGSRASPTSHLSLKIVPHLKLDQQVGYSHSRHELSLATSTHS